MEASTTTLNIAQTTAAPAAEPVVATTENPEHTHGKLYFGRRQEGCPACEALPPRMQRLPRKPAATAPAQQKVYPTTAAIPSTTTEYGGEVPQITDHDAALLGYRGDRPEPGLTREDVLALLAQMQTAPADALPVQPTQLEQLLSLLVGREAKIAQKEANDEIRKEQGRQDMVRMASEQIELEQQRWAMCEASRHRKENGRSAVSGQVHNDGLYHPFCQRCFKMLTPRTPRNDEITNGINVN